MNLESESVAIMSNHILVALARISFAAAFAVSTTLAFASPAAAVPAPVGPAHADGDTRVAAAVTSGNRRGSTMPAMCLRGDSRATPLIGVGEDRCPDDHKLSCEHPRFALRTDHDGPVDLCVPKPALPPLPIRKP